MPAGRAAAARATSSESARRWPPCSCGAATPIPAARGRFSRARCPGTTRSCSATCARRSRTIRAAVDARQADLRPRRLRRRRHLRDRARGVPAARARRRPRLAPPVALRGGLRPERADAREARRRRRRPRPHRRLRHHRRRRGRRRRSGSASRSSSPTITGPATTFPDCPVVAPLKGDYPVRRPLRHRRRLEARRGAARRRASRSSSGTSTSSRSPPSPTSSRSSTRTARSRSPGLRRLAQTQKPGPAGADARRGRRSGGLRRGRDRLPARAADQRRRAGSAVPRRRSRCS